MTVFGSKIGSKTRAFIVASAISAAALLPAPLVAEPAADTSHIVAFLGVTLQNDNAIYEPTSDAERARMAALETQFKTHLENSGRYKFVAMTADVQQHIDAGQPVGTCGGCESAYGKSLGANTVAWIGVQKISNLIMNMNVYIADVQTAQMLFQHSVDIRGNTDETWSRSLAFLLKNYLVPPKAPQPAG